MAIAYRLDFVLLALALPLFIAASFPLSAWVVTAVAWCIQRWVRAWAVRRAKVTDDPRTLVGLLAGSLIGRGWFMAISIFACGMIYGDRAGLCAAVLTVALFTALFTVEMLFRPFEEAEGR
jgi:hypothetical protein